jgi:hypothetical protein
MHRGERNSGVLAEVFHGPDLVLDLFVPQMCSRVSRLKKPNKDVRKTYTEADLEAKVEGTLEETNIRSWPASF